MIRQIALVAILSGFYFSEVHVLPAAELKNLRCEYRENPLGIYSEKPRLSWILESKARGEKQTAFRVLVASMPDKLAQDEGDLWDSGKVAASQSAHVAYDGRLLESGQ
jgi:alpha-L-rhamnosidase